MAAAGVSAGDLDFVKGMVKKLLSVKDAPPQTPVKLDPENVNKLIKKALATFKAESSLLEMEAPITICGDIHGQYYDLLRVFEVGGMPPKTRYLFLGDYVDRGNQGIETLCLMLSFKVLYPKHFFMLRGNHECASITRIYGFYDECKRRYSIKLWRNIIQIFNLLPFAAIVSQRLFCVHGGLSPELDHMDRIRAIERPTAIPDFGVICDLVWADPDPDLRGWGLSERGVSFTFGPDVIRKFLQKHDLDLLVRAHQVVQDGYEFCGNRDCVTLFTAARYCGEFDNAAAMMIVTKDLMISFKVLTWDKSKAGAD